MFHLISNGTSKMKLAILAFLCCGEFVKNLTDQLFGWLLFRSSCEKSLWWAKHKMYENFNDNARNSIIVWEQLCTVTERWRSWKWSNKSFSQSLHYQWRIQDFPNGGRCFVANGGAHILFSGKKCMKLKEIGLKWGAHVF